MYGWQQHICDVCRLLDGDETLKECQYCKACDAWMCRADYYSAIRRGLAALERKLESEGGGS
jgi:hypothetical protein